MARSYWTPARLIPFKVGQTFRWARWGRGLRAFSPLTVTSVTESDYYGNTCVATNLKTGETFEFSSADIRGNPNQFREAKD